MHFDQLIKLTGKLGEEGADFFQLGLSSFITDVISDERISFPNVAEEDGIDLTDIQERFDTDTFQRLFMNAVEFFFSNEYQGEKGVWNAVDFLLKKRGPLFSHQDKMYLKGLQKSYMSLYEVTDVELDHSITVRNLLEDKAPLQVVKEKMATRSLCPWDLIGARLVHVPQGTFFAGGLLVLDRESMHASKEIIQEISDVMMNKHSLALFQGFTKDPELLIKKMWAKEIVQNWLIQETRETLPPILVNYEGDPLEFYTTEFPLKASVQKVVEHINQLPNFIARDDLEENPHAWIWEFKEEKKTPTKKTPKKQEQNNEQIRRIDSHICLDGAAWIRYRAELKIQQKTLVIDVNSEKRAIDAEAFFQKHLRSLLGVPTRTKLEVPPASNKNGDHDDEMDISPEEQEMIVQDMLEQHYTDWLDHPLPILKNKTPRQAVKTQKGRNDVTNLLKDMQNAELHAVKNGHQAKPYSFDWMFAELGIDQQAFIAGQIQAQNQKK